MPEKIASSSLLQSRVLVKPAILSFGWLKRGRLETAALTPPESSTCGEFQADPAVIRKAMGLSQTEFARLLAVSVRTLHKWEQHASRPSGAAESLLKVAAANPHAVRHALCSRVT